MPVSVPPTSTLIPVPPTATPIPPTETPTPLPPTATLMPTGLPDTPPPPPATSKPKPTSKPTETPTPQQVTKGCYLFLNHLGAEVTVTLTAQDWQWADTLLLPPGGEREYCLDPGRYTYTLDAPPPWGSTNGEMVVAAGDRYQFPIRGQ
jgi:hypothetical protein